MAPICGCSGPTRNEIRPFLKFRSFFLWYFPCRKMCRWFFCWLDEPAPYTNYINYDRFRREKLHVRKYIPFCWPSLRGLEAKFVPMRPVEERVERVIGHDDLDHMVVQRGREEGREGTERRAALSFWTEIHSKNSHFYENKVNQILANRIRTSDLRNYILPLLHC